MTFSRLFRRSGWIRGLVAALLAFLGYGGWAFYINSGYSQWVALRSGMVQGGYSFLLTLTTTAMIELLYRCFRLWRYRAWLTFAVTTVFLSATAYAIHHALGTPEILSTILPGFVIGSVYSGFYIRALHSHVLQAE